MGHFINFNTGGGGGGTVAGTTGVIPYFTAPTVVGDIDGGVRKLQFVNARAGLSADDFGLWLEGASDRYLGMGNDANYWEMASISTGNPYIGLHTEQGSGAVDFFMAPRSASTSQSYIYVTGAGGAWSQVLLTANVAGALQFDSSETVNFDWNLNANTNTLNFATGTYAMRLQPGNSADAGFRIIRPETDTGNPFEYRSQDAFLVETTQFAVQVGGQLQIGSNPDITISTKGSDEIVLSFGATPTEFIFADGVSSSYASWGIGNSFGNALYFGNTHNYIYFQSVSEGQNYAEIDVFKDSSNYGYLRFQTEFFTGFEECYATLSAKAQGVEQYFQLYTYDGTTYDYADFFLSSSSKFRIAFNSTYGLYVNSAKLLVHRDSQIGFGSTINIGAGASDTGLKRLSAGVLKPTDGSTGFGALDVEANTNAIVPLSVRAHSTQAVNIQAWYDAGGSLNASIDANCNFYINNTTFLGRTSSATTPSATEYPNPNDWGYHEDTVGGALYLAFNYSGSIVKVQLT